MLSGGQRLMPTCQPVTLPLQDIVIFGPIMRQEIGREIKSKATHAKKWQAMKKLQNR